MDGGISQVVKLAAETFFRKPYSFQDGILADGTSQPLILFAKLGLLVADAQAIQHGLSVKGTAGLLPCFLCKNVTLARSDLHAHDATNTLIPHTWPSLDRCQLLTDNELRNNVAKLKANRNVVSAAKFATMEKSTGLTWCENGALFDDGFHDLWNGCLLSSVQWDWMHNYLVGGIFNKEAGFLLEAVKNVTTMELKAFLSECEWPKAVRGRAITGYKLLDKRESGDLQCSASEGLSMYPVIRHWVMQHVSYRGHQCEAAVCSFFALCKVLDLLSSLKRGRGSVNPDDLEAAVSTHFQLRLLAYGPDRCQPKMHLALHHSQHLRRHGMLVSCYVHERKHKALKAFAGDYANANPGFVFEKSLLTNVVVQQVEHLRTFEEGRSWCLKNPVPAQEALQGHVQRFLQAPSFCAVTMSKEAYTRPTELCAQDDVVELDDGRVGQVWFHCFCDATLVTVFCPWQALGDNVYQVCEVPVFVGTKQVQRCLSYRRVGGAKASVVP